MHSDAPRQAATTKRVRPLPAWRAALAQPRKARSLAPVSRT